MISIWAGPFWAALIWLCYGVLIIAGLRCAVAAFKARTWFGRDVFALAAIVLTAVAIRLALIFAGVLIP